MLDSLKTIEKQCFLQSLLWGNLSVLNDLCNVAGFHHYAENSINISKTETLVIKRHMAETEKCGHAHLQL